jgi:hypothetical protein
MDGMFVASNVNDTPKAKPKKHKQNPFRQPLPPLLVDLLLLKAIVRCSEMIELRVRMGLIRSED